MAARCRSPSLFRLPQAILSLALASFGGAFAPVGRALALVGLLLALVGQPLALVGIAVASIGATFAPIGVHLPPADCAFSVTDLLLGRGGIVRWVLGPCQHRGAMLPRSDSGRYAAVGGRYGQS